MTNVRCSRPALPGDRARCPDAGISLIEVAIVVVLLGTVVAATLTAMRTTIHASVLDRDHANAHAWLQTSADMLYARAPYECDETNANPAADIAAGIASYQTTVSATDNPENWPMSNIQVISLEWWFVDIVNGVAFESFGTACSGATTLQKIGLRVRNPDGRIVEEVEVIVGGETR